MEEKFKMLIYLLVSRVLVKTTLVLISLSTSPKDLYYEYDTSNKEHFAAKSTTPSKGILLSYEKERI